MKSMNLNILTGTLTTILMVTTWLSAIDSFHVKRIGKVKVGKGPQFSQISIDGKFLFVTAFVSNEVAILDMNTLRKIDTFYAGFEPIGITVSPTGDKIFVTNRKNGLIKVVDLPSYTVIDDIKVGGRPAQLIASPTGLLIFVANWGSGKFGKVDVIDTNEIPEGISPIAGVVSPLGDYLFLACSGSNDLWVININTLKTVKKISVGIQPSGVAISLDGNTLYVTNNKTHDLSVNDLLELKETRRERLGNRPFSLTIDSKGRIFVVESGDNIVSVFDTELEKIGSFSVGKGSLDIDVSHDNRHIFVTAEKENRLFIFEIQ